MKIVKKSFLGLVAIATMAFMSSCEGPMGPQGPAGADGADGADGTDANQTCKLCHAPDQVDLITVQFEFAKHGYGEAAFEEAGNTQCSPCHVQEGFKDVVARNVPATFTINAATGNYVIDYQCSSSTAYGELGCSTCHNQIHATYDGSDLPSLTTVAPVSMPMWNGTKTIDLQQNDAKSNLCVKCHQPRAVTVNTGASPTGGPLDYASMADQANWNTPVWTGTSASAGTGKHKPGYRSHIHYGAVGAVFAGEGPIEIAGDEQYTNSAHTAAASCVDCHMAPMYNRAGEHTFMVRATAGALGSSTSWNFQGCNATGCHTGVDSKSTSYWIDPRNNIKALLNQLASILTIVHNDGNTYELLNRNADAETNLWAGITTNNYDGYLNIINSSNPNTGPTVIPNTWFTLTNLQMVAIINFQFGLREYSLGIHNYDYTHALLSNTIQALGATPVN